MPIESWEKIQELFYAAADLPPAAQSRFLDTACNGDPNLRREVETLLVSDQSGGADLDSAVQEAAQELLGMDAVVGTRVGVWRIVREIGRGGMGVVYLAVRDDDQFHKKAALKLIKHGMDTVELLNRFRGERQILASLDHPYIARLIDGGATPDGRPFLVMEYVEGQPITEWCRERDLPVEDRCRLMLKVCEAVSFAHRNLIVHRDLKPANLLVTAEGLPKLLDFGLAKLLEPSTDSSQTATVAASRMVTPAYASPEQVLGQKVTTAADVYSLGAVLYELLSGSRAHRLHSLTPAEAERAICHTEVTRPSLAVDKQLPHSGRLRKRLAGDLDNIVLMAMRKEPDRRYRSVDQLAEDIRRHIEGRPVAARQDSLGYRCAKFIRRHRAAAAGALTVALIGIAGIIAILWEARRAEIQRQRAEARVGQLVELANRTLFDVHGAIERLPGATDARRRIVATTLEYLDRLAPETKDDARVQLALASAYTRLADIEGSALRPNLGEWASAIETQRKAIRILDQLRAQDPRNSTYLLRRAQLSDNVSTTLMIMGRTLEATNELNLGLDLTGKLLAKQPADLETQLLQGQLRLARLGVLVERDPAAAERECAGHLPGFKRLAAEHPDNVDALIQLAGATSALGVVASLLNSPTNLSYYRDAARLLESALTLRPHDALAQRLLLRAYVHIAASLNARRGNPAEILRYMRNAQSMAQALGAVDPSDAMTRFDSAIAYRTMAHMHAPVVTPAESLAMLGKARSILEPCALAFPAGFRLTLALATIDHDEARGLEKLHRYREALTSYRRTLDLETHVAAAGKGTFADRDKVVTAAEICRLLALMSKRDEAVRLAAETANSSVALWEAWPAYVPQTLGILGDALATLARKDRSFSRKADDWRAAEDYYEQAQRAWPKVPEKVRRTYAGEIRANDEALAAARAALQ